MGTKQKRDEIRFEGRAEGETEKKGEIACRLNSIGGTSEPLEEASHDSVMARLASRKDRRYGGRRGRT